MRKFSAVAGAFAVVIFIAVPVGIAATPQQIYRDYADNGRLDGHYSKSDLQRALKDATVQGYTTPGGGGLTPAVKKKAGQEGNQSGTAGVSTPAVTTSGLPFTGLDLVLITIGGVLLLAFGVGLRRFGRRTT